MMSSMHSKISKNSLWLRLSRAISVAFGAYDFALNTKQPELAPGGSSG
jgi:hypothetical protein